jgi:hypothetical protein
MIQARDYAQRVLGDDRFSTRVRDLLAQIKP